MKSLIQKYNQPGPRYTSYPTVPFWEADSISPEIWKESLIQNTSSKEGVSLYIHLPFCEQLCTFCGCHKRITKNHKFEDPYIATLLKEWQLYTKIIGREIIIKEIHLGGGTPTFFSPENLETLILGIKENSVFDTDVSLSFEAHPNNTSEDHLRKLYNLGFRRLSLGIQDYDEKVQKTINRVQSFEQVEKVHLLAKEIGYSSISHDIIYGLPHQTLESIKKTISYTSQLKPERISFYSYAHVPWVKGVGQRGYNEEDLPKNEEKQELYEYGKEALIQLGYEEIGMDHFALKTDELFKAHKQGELHRNFMGYTTQKSNVLIGLGMSAISDSWGAFAQNDKHVESYMKKIEAGNLAIFRGHLLNQEDLEIRRLILDLMCRFETKVNHLLLEHDAVNTKLLQEMISDNLVKINNEKIILKPDAKAFIRNLCMCFDLRLNRKKLKEKLFSSTI